MNRFDKAISALSNAYTNNTLFKGNCISCAVGNIICDANDLTIHKEISGNRCGYNIDVSNGTICDWEDLFCTTSGLQTISNGSNIETTRLNVIVKQLSKTGYSIKELAMIEETFENNTNISHHIVLSYTDTEVRSDTYTGLMAVVDTLCDIEEKTDEQRTGVKELFKYTA